MKKIFAMILAIVLCFVVATAAFAADTNGAVTPEPGPTPNIGSVDLNFYTSSLNQTFQVGDTAVFYAKAYVSPTPSTIPVIFAKVLNENGKTVGSAYYTYDVLESTAKFTVNTAGYQTGKYYLDIEPGEGFTGEGARAAFYLASYSYAPSSISVYAKFGGETESFSNQQVTEKTATVNVFAVANASGEIKFTVNPINATGDKTAQIGVSPAYCFEYTVSSDNTVNISKTSHGKGYINCRLAGFDITVIVEVCTDLNGHILADRYVGNKLQTYCTKCGYIDLIRATGDGHNFVLFGQKDPTCTEAGYTGDMKCIDCGEVSEYGSVIPATGHSVTMSAYLAPSCTEPGYTTKSCGVCGMDVETTQIPALGHDWDNGIVVTEESNTAIGVRQYTCSRCNAIEKRTFHTCPAEGYLDKYKDTNWAHVGIDYCIRAGIMGSTSTSKLTFEPAATLTRAQLATILWKLENKPIVKEVAPFTDTKAGAWYWNAVNWAYATGVIKGVPNNDGTLRFDLSVPVSREVFATMLYRYCVEKYPDAIFAGSADISSYADAESVHSYARDAMVWAVQHGIIQGLAENNEMYLRPRNTATRAQTAVIFMRYLEKYEK